MDDIFEKINKAGVKLLEPLTLEKTYEICASEAVKLVNGNEGSILLEKEGNFIVAYATSKLLYDAKPRKKGYSYEAFKKNKVIITHRKEIMATHPKVAQYGFKSSVFIPLSFKKQSIGVLVITSTIDQRFSKSDLDVLKLFGSMVSMAIRKAQLSEETEKALKTRDLFISMAAHELRTPLTSISGYIQLLRKKLKEKSSIESKWMEDLYLESLRLSNMVSELLEIGRIQSGKMQFEFKEHDLLEIMRRSIEFIYFNKPDRRIILHNKLNNDKNIIIGDNNKLIQAFTNILENAMRYSPSNTDIIIKMSKNSSEYLIEIIDKGKGISKKDLNSLFERYYRGKNVEEEGMGLGLYLTKNIINKHRGYIEINSKLNKGTTVKLRLPILKYGKI